jgi:hypothetical protein
LTNGSVYTTGVIVTPHTARRLLGYITHELDTAQVRPSLTATITEVITQLATQLEHPRPTSHLRVLRLLEYVGDDVWLRKQLARTGVPLIGEHSFEDGALIRSGVVGLWPGTLTAEEVAERYTTTT